MDIKTKENCQHLIRLAVKAEREKNKKVFELYKEEARNLRIDADELWEALQEGILQ